MTREDIIRMAEQAGMFYMDYIRVDSMKQIEHFAALVAAAEREACAKVCEEPGWNAANWCAKAIRARSET